MGYNSFIFRSPKKEEQQVPDTIVTTEFSEGKDGNLADEEVDIMDDLERILGINNEDEDQKLTKGNTNIGQLNWEFMDWNEFRNGEEEEEDYEDISEQKLLFYDKDYDKKYKCFFEEDEDEEEGYYRRGDMGIIKKEQVGFWDDDYKRVSLNLNLNYQEVLDAWSDRGSLWADEYSRSMATNGSYVSIH